MKIFVGEDSEFQLRFGNDKVHCQNLVFCYLPQKSPWKRVALRRSVPKRFNPEATTFSMCPLMVFIQFCTSFRCYHSGFVLQSFLVNFAGGIKQPLIPSWQKYLFACMVEPQFTRNMNGDDFCVFCYPELLPILIKNWNCKDDCFPSATYSQITYSTQGLRIHSGWINVSAIPNFTRSYCKFFLFPLNRH